MKKKYNCITVFQQAFTTEIVSRGGGATVRTLGSRVLLQQSRTATIADRQRFPKINSNESPIIEEKI
jgi:hypothetical protein